MKRRHALRSLLACVVGVVCVAASISATSAAHTSRAQSRYLLKGIDDDAQILYGNPDWVFPTLHRLGTNVIRVTLWWGGPNGVARSRPAQPSNPLDTAYDWSTYDRTVEYAARYNIKPIFTVLGTPQWESGNSSWNVAPKRITDLKQFVLAAARRYSGSFTLPDGTILPAVRRWIAWNEPNNPVFLRPQFVKARGKWVMESAKTYASICNAVVSAAKLVASGNEVACGVTAPRGNNQAGSARASVSPLAFLRAMKRYGARGFDAYAHHPYYSSRLETPATRPTTGRHGAPATAITLGNIDLLTNELQRLYGNVRLWITEYGYQTNPPDRTIGVSWKQQAMYMREAWLLAKANPHIDLFVWFLLRDESRLDGWQSGMFTASGKRKPSASTYTSLR